MEQLELQINVISAKGLKDVKCITKMRTYAAVRIDPFAVLFSPLDGKGGINPTWNFKFEITVPRSYLTWERSMLTIQLLSPGCIGESKVGTVVIPTIDIIRGGSNRLRFLSYRVSRPSGRSHGILNISVLYREKEPSTTQLPNEPGGRVQHTAENPRFDKKGLAFGTVAGF